MDINNQVCKVCNKELNYNSNYDSYYCKECDVWAEETCDDENCCFCVGRPKKPSEA